MENTTLKPRRACLGALAVGALMAAHAAFAPPAAATPYMNMQITCEVLTPDIIGQFACGSNEIPKHLDGLDGHMWMTEMYYSANVVDVKITMSGQVPTGMYENGQMTYYSLGLDKTVWNGTMSYFNEFDIVMLPGTENWPAWVMYAPMPMELNGHYPSYMQSSAGLWFQGGLSYGQDAIFWLPISVPMMVTQGDTYDQVDGWFIIRQEPKIPEPMSVALFGTGLAGLGFMRRRRRV